MAFTNEKRLERWLRQQFFGDHEETLERFVVRHSPSGTKGSIVLEKKIVDRVTEDDLNGIVTELLDVVESDASGMGGLQRYAIDAMREGRETPSGRFTCRVTGHDDSVDDDNDVVDTEAPTKHGLISQQMRHNEALVKTLAQILGSTANSMQRTIAQQAEHIERLQEQRFKSFDVIESALSEQHRREMEMLQLSSGEDRKDKAVEKALTLLPAIVNRVSGRKLLPEASSPRDIMLKDLIASLEGDQFEKIATSLKPEQQILFIELLKAFKSDEEKPPPNGKS
jgi:hypothetical protein